MRAWVAWLAGCWLWLACLPALAEPIHEAAALGSTVEVEKILSADPQAWRRLDSQGMTPLLLALKEGQVGVVELLLQRGADPNQASPQNWTPLHEAAVKGQADMVGLLLEKGAKPRVSEKQNHGTPLHIACFQGQLEVCEKLIKSGADINARDRERLTPMWHARDQGHWKLVKWLKARGAK